MPRSIYSRYGRVPSYQTKDAAGEAVEVLGLPQTTILAPGSDATGQWYVVVGDETFESIAHEVYFDRGGAELWWVLAMVNKHIVYPLDLQAGDRLLLPEPEWVSRYVNSVNDWRGTWLRRP